MATHKHFDKLCALVLVFCLLITLLAYQAEGLGVQAFSAQLGYESRLFTTDRVHTIDIRMDDWEGFLRTAQSEEYTVCDVVIDGETVQDVGIRGKGNTSLSTVSSMDSNRYSFKIEFDQYDSTRSYHGLDKLCLNNLIQDNTMMKDYLVYQMMNAFGVASPLCSFAYITVNGEDWGLYLAVEAVEDSFLRRNYGNDYGELYKPDSMSMGGGRGNGRDFDMADWQQEEASDSTQPNQTMPGGRGQRNSQQNAPSADGSDPAAPTMPQMPGNFDPSSLFGEDGSFQLPEEFDPSTFSDKMGGFEGGFGGMGSSDVKLQYIDDDPESYSNIFDSAKTTLTDADKTRLIQALQALGQFDSSAVDVDAVLRYFVVHNFVVNGDSYTGGMVHNYYLREKAGQLSMIPWDYNLAFGTFQSSSASSAVNDDIDAPLSCSGNGDRPMMDWIVQNSTYTQLYHDYFADFLDSVDIAGMISHAAQLIAPYVETDPTKFCTYEEHLAGVTALQTFCDLRSQSVRAQLSGDTAPIDTGDLQLDDLGTMNMGGGFGKDNRGDRQRQNQTETQPTIPTEGVFAPGQGFGGQFPTDRLTEETGQQEQAEQNAVPDGFSGQFSGMGNMTFPGQAAESASGGSQLALLGISTAVLLLGLLIAWKYRR